MEPFLCHVFFLVSSELLRGTSIFVSEFWWQTKTEVEESICSVKMGFLSPMNLGMIEVGDTDIENRGFIHDLPIEKMAGKSFLQVPFVGFGVFDMLTVFVPKRKHSSALGCVLSPPLSEEIAFITSTVLAASGYFSHNAAFE